MPLNRLFRPTLMAALAGGLAATASTATANVEIGGTAGIHIFSTTNELGVADVGGATSERNSALFGLRLGAFFGDMIGIEAEVGVIPSESRSLVFDIWNVTYRAHVVAQFRAKNPAMKLVPFVLVGGGAMSVVDSANTDVIDEDTDEILYAGIGAKYRVDNGWGLRADARILFPPSSEDEGITQDFELLLSIYKEFGRKQVEKVIEPPPVDDDPDKDGVVGAADECPSDPEDKDGFQDENGCPDADNDKDKICDPWVEGSPNADKYMSESNCKGKDQCPDQPEDYDGDRDEDGCPDLKAEFDGCSVKIKDKVFFKFDKSEIDPKSFELLNDVATVVNSVPEELHFDVEGHTDSKGSDKYNKKLSQARADAVREYLVGRGVKRDRLVAKGYGEERPIDSNRSNDGRARNRRVEFNVNNAKNCGP
jgi:outer membrane protein OmpA-like peptidoglycan-associated protein